MSDKPKNLQDIDAYWDLDSLLPPKRPSASPRRAVNTETVEFEFRETITGAPGAAIPPRRTVENIHARTDRVPSDRTDRTPAAEDPDPDKEKKDIFDFSDVPSGASSARGDGEPFVRRSPRDEACRLNELTLKNNLKTRSQDLEQRPLEPYLVYTPESAIIRSVSVAKWQTRYRFYEKFRADVHRYWERAASECEPVPFFSYVPQYNQLKYAQLKWYLWWRDNLRRGNYLRTDYSYILLYIYEILNCPELIPPEKGVRLLCEIWAYARTAYPRIDVSLAEWLCDYCLIYRLPCPTEELEPFLKAVVSAAAFREFYMDTSRKTEGPANILAYSSNYDWRSSRYVTAENVKVFAEHIRAAFERAYREILSEADNGATVKLARLERDAFGGALCVYDMKRSLTIEYLSYTRSPKFRFTVTDIIKYSENRVRMALGIKARLKIDDLSDELRACLDAYFDEHLPAKKSAPKDKAPAVPVQNEYDKLYEPVSTTLSLENAMDIEKRSWSTTEILTAAFDGSEEQTAAEPSEPVPTVPAGMPSVPKTAAPVPAAEPSVPKTAAPVPAEVQPVQSAAAPVPAETVSDETDGADEFASLVEALDDTARTALRLLAGGDRSGLARTAAADNTLADALADRINEAAFELLGDSVIEPDGDGWRLIREYEGELIKWLK